MVLQKRRINLPTNQVRHEYPHSTWSKKPKPDTGIDQAYLHGSLNGLSEIVGSYRASKVLR